MAKKYKVPSGAKVRPSQIGHYNFWYPHDHKETVSTASIICEQLPWYGSTAWQAVRVSLDDATQYDSPIKVLWVEKKLFNDVVKAPFIRGQLKTRADKG
jgi:hypothetical protein